MNLSRKAEILHQIRMFAGDQRHFEEPGGTKETARRLGILWQVRRYAVDHNKDTTRIDLKVGRLLELHPDLRDLMVQYMSMAESQYVNTLATGDFVDGDGATFLKWCLKSFGERMDDVFDSGRSEGA